MTTRRDHEADRREPGTVHLVLEPAGCDECGKRSKCRYRASSTQHKCAMARGRIMRIVCMLLLAAGTACAQWPSPAHQYNSFERGNQALSGAVERASVTTSPKIWTNSTYSSLYGKWFSQRTKCVAAKTILSNAVAYGAWIFPTNSYNPDMGMRVTHSNLLARVGAPTNWWVSTPWFNLASESNGWWFMDSIQSNLVWTEAPVDYYPVTFTNTAQMMKFNVRPDECPVGYPSYYEESDLSMTNVLYLNARGTADSPIHGETNSWLDSKMVVDGLFRYIYSDVLWWNPYVKPSTWPAGYPKPNLLFTESFNAYTVAARPTAQVSGGAYPVYSDSYNYSTNWTYDPYGGPVTYFTNYSTPWNYEITEITTQAVVSATYSSNLTLLGSRFQGIIITNLTPIAFVTNTVISTNWGLVYHDDGQGTNYNDVQYSGITNYDIISTNFDADVSWRYTANKSQVSSYPYAGNVVSNSYSAMPMISTNVSHTVDIWLKFDSPFAPQMNSTNDVDGPAYWTEYDFYAYPSTYQYWQGSTSYSSTNSTYDLHGDAVNVPATNGWYCYKNPTNSDPIQWGPYIGVSNNLSYIINTNLWCAEPNHGEITARGWDVRTNQAVVKWMFNWFR